MNSMTRLLMVLLFGAASAINIVISHAKAASDQPADGCEAGISSRQISSEIDQLVHDNKWNSVEIPREQLNRWLHGCEFEQGMRKLNAAGFKISQDEKLSIFELNQGVQRVAVGDKLLRIMNHPIAGPMGSFRAMIVLREIRGKLEAYGRFYADGP